jgi:Tol biopolymer transport system component
MFKKYFLIIILILLILAIWVGILLLLKQKNQPPEEAEFFKGLKGEIVFTRRDGLYLNIYKIKANGKDEKMLYHHENKLNSNASHPEWSKDGTKIYFTAMEGTDWKNIKSKKFMIDINGSNVQFLPKGTEFRLGLASQSSREKDIIVRQGSIYYLDKEGKEVLVFSFSEKYDPAYNPGAQEVSWSPDKEYLIFELKGYITVINKKGTKMAKITKGGEPDWKY